MKRFCGILISALLLVLPVLGIEWGGLATDETKLFTQDFKKDYTQIQSASGLSLWLNVPFTQSGSFYFAGQGSYKYYFDFDLNKNTSNKSVANLDLLKVNGTVNVGSSVITTAAGRYTVSDLTGKIFNQTSDGISVKYALPSIELSVYGGYTGLQNALSVSMLDKNGAVHAAKDKVYSMAHQYVPVSIAVEVPSLFLNQTLNAQANGFIDLEASKYHRFYITAGLNGPIAGPVYYAFNTAFETPDFKEFGLFSEFNVQAFIASAVIIKAGAEYASGEQLIFKPFKGFTSHNAYSSLYTEELSSLLLPSLEFAVTNGNIYLGAGGKAVCRFPKSDIIFSGVSATGNLVVNIFSDLKLDLAASYFYDKETAGARNNLSVATNVSVAF